MSEAVGMPRMLQCTAAGVPPAASDLYFES